MLSNLSFDGILADKNGSKLDVDCSISLPIISGAAAAVTIHIPLVATRHAELANPCTLRGRAGSTEVEINELWYHSFPLGGTERRLARDVMVINHIGNLKVRYNHWKNAETCVTFHLSAVEFFKNDTQAAMTRYSDTPNQTVELFKINVGGLGEVTFLKQWAIHHVKDGTASAKIHAGFYARVMCEEASLKNIDTMVETFKDVLTVLSIFFRQAVSLLGWEMRSSNGTENLWVAPLQPNLAPYIPMEPNVFLALPGEFQECAQEFVAKYLAANKRVKGVIRHLSVALAPHVPVAIPTSFLQMFGALEQAIDLAKLSEAEKQNLGKSDADLVGHLKRTRAVIEAESSAFKGKLLERVDGFIKVVESGTLSFTVKLEALIKQYPGLKLYTSDLWPIEGSDGKPGLKEMRNRLTHGGQSRSSAQALAVARWHFSIFLERLVFVMVGATVPKGISGDSFLLSRDGWYGREYWSGLQKTALN